MDGEVLMKFNYQVMNMRPLYAIHCEWGIVPALYGSETNARIMCDLFQKFPKNFWPIRFCAGIRFTESPELREREEFYHGEWVLFLPEYCRVFWGFKTPGQFPKPNIFTSEQEAFDYALERGEFNVIRIPKHRSRFLAR